MPSACIYVRVSSEEQAGPGRYSIDQQLADCRALADKLGLTIVAEYEDASAYRSHGRLVEPAGHRPDRPAWLSLLADADAHLFTAVLAFDETRLYRGYRPALDFLECYERNRLAVHLARDQFNQQFTMIKAWMAKEENERRVARSLAGRRGRARAGLPPNGGLLGYRPVRDERGRAIAYQLDQAWDSFFAELARLFTGGLSYERIGAALGHNPSTGRPWDSATIRVIVRNPGYRGTLQYGRRAQGGIEFTVPAAIPQRWTGETAAAIETELARRTALGRSVAHSPERAPLAGAVRCGYCGHLMTPHSSRNQSGSVYRRYECSYNRARQKGLAPGDPHPPNSASELRIFKSLQDFIAALTPADVDDYLAQMHAATSPTSAGRADYLRAQLARLSGQVVELEGELGRVGQAARAALSAEIDRLGRQADEFTAELAQAQTDAAHAPDAAALRDRMLAIISQPQQFFDLPPDELRQVIRSNFGALYVRHGEIVTPVAVG